MYKMILSSVCAMLVLSGCGGGTDFGDGSSSDVNISEDINTSDINTSDINTSDTSSFDTNSSDTNSSDSNLSLSNEDETVYFYYAKDIKANHQNPDRGFYDASYELSKDSDYNMFANLQQRGYTLAYASINLQDYTQTKNLPSDILEHINKNLQDARDSKIKLIFRIKYRSSIDSNDSSKDIITSHLKQLKPILQNYKDTISVVQAGVIGAWGEWHSFTGDYADTNATYLQNRLDILKTWIDIFPSKYIQIRTPMHKEQLLGAGGEYAETSTDGEITADIAYSDDIRAKVGYHNDCVLSNQTDMGTYSSNDIDFWKRYVRHDTLYVPIGGETCGIGSEDDAKLSDCTNAIKEFRAMRYSFLNDNYHPDVLEKWKQQGCYDDIKYNLGYRIVADRLQLTKNDNLIKVSLDISNQGYAPPYVNYPVKFILETMNYTDKFDQDIDTRKWYPQIKQTIYTEISVENVDKNETYCLYLQVGTPNTYVRFANANIWSDDLEANRLFCIQK